MGPLLRSDIYNPHLILNAPVNVIFSSKTANDSDKNLKKKGSKHCNIKESMLQRSDIIHTVLCHTLLKADITK